MMRLPKFERLLPSSLADACQMLNQHKGEAEPIAGGTDLLVSMKQRVLTPKYLVDLTTIPNLDFLAYDNKEGLRMGPLTKIIKLAGDAKVAEKYPALAQAAASVGAKIKLASPKGERVIPLVQLYSGDGKEYLTKEKDELVSEINVPAPSAKS